MTDHPTEQLPLAAAGLLDDPQAAAVRAHLRGCPSCADELRGWEGIAVAAKTAAEAPRSAEPPRPDQPPRPDEARQPDGQRPDDPTPEGGTFAPLAHLTADKAERYRAVLEVFAAERERFLIHLRPDDVARTLGEGVAPVLHDELAKLVGWGNLRDLPDTQRVTTVEDFHSRRRLYALTPAGEAAEQAIGVYTRALGRRAELQTVALADISQGLASLRTLVEEARHGGGPDDAGVAVPRDAGGGPDAGVEGGGGGSDGAGIGGGEVDDARDSRRGATPRDMDAGRAAAVLRDLTGVFEALAENAAAFMSSLARAIDAAADRGTFLVYKDRLLSYLQRFLTDLVSRSSQIAGELVAIGDVTPVVTAVAAREAVDAAPGIADGSAAAPDIAAGTAPDGDLHHEIGARTLAWLRRWEGLRAWFLGTATTPAQSDLLRRRALTSIRELLAAAAAINERRTGRSDRAADYRALARWFAEAPDDDSCHRLWRAALGVTSSRHLTVDGDTLARREDDPTPPATAWHAAEPVRISPRLRATGHHERRGRLRSVTDRTDAQAALRRLVAEERADLAALDVLPRGRPLRLSELQLDADAFAILLDLLSDALAASAPSGGQIVTESRDGSLRIVLDPPANGRLAVIPTPHGVLRGPDHVLTLHPAVLT